MRSRTFEMLVVHMCVCVRERERERINVSASEQYFVILANDKYVLMQELRGEYAWGHV